MKTNMLSKGNNNKIECKHKATRKNTTAIQQTEKHKSQK